MPRRFDGEFGVISRVGNRSRSVVGGNLPNAVEVCMTRFFKKGQTMIRNSFFLALLVLLVGCGGHVSLKGKVVYSEDKSPVPTGTICFETDTYLARGTISSDGTFVVGSIKQRDGLPAGSYRVYFVDVHELLGYDYGGAAIYEPLIDQKYASSSTSGITLEVTRSTKTFEIEVDRAPTKRR
jgi:hypothetical protein